MLQLLSPLALVALAALAIPAILHLWRPPPTVVRLGTLRFFTAPAVRRLTKLRWRELLLLAVRLLLLGMLALLLAQPIWTKEPPTTPQRWALIEPGIVLQGEALKRWRELDDLGFDARELARGFRRIPPPLDADGNAAAADDVWSLLREVDARLPIGSQVVVFASDRVAALSGERPSMQRCKAEWISSSGPSPTDSAWISSADVVRGAGGDARKLRILVSTSNAAHTQTIAVDGDGVAGKTALTGALNGWSIEVITQDDRISARLLRNDGSAAAGPWLSAADYKPLGVAILHAENRAEDAAYVRAAIRAIAETSGREIALNDDHAGADWIIWLNDQPPPTELVREATQRGATLLSDAEESDDAATALVTSLNAEELHQPVALFRRVPPIAQSGATLWSDGFGTPLLSVAREDAGRRLRFFSRFHPEWNDLPRSSALAAALRPLLLTHEHGRASSHQQDQRRADASQGAPSDAPPGEPSAGVSLRTAGEIVDLHSVLWLVCAALFAVERILSHRNQRRSEPASTVPRREPALAEHA